MLPRDTFLQIRHEHIQVEKHHAEENGIANDGPRNIGNEQTLGAVDAIRLGIATDGLIEIACLEKEK